MAAGVDSAELDIRRGGSLWARFEADGWIRVDGSLVATYDDPKPLTGDRFALWTWDNGIMVAQCRVSSDASGEAVPPVGPAGATVPKTPYDQQ